MKSLVLCCIFSSIFLVNFVYSKVSIRPIIDDGVQFVTFVEGKSFALSCKAESNLKDEKFDVEWKKSGVIVDDDDSLKGRFKVSHEDSIYKLEIKKATAADIGNYTCGVDDENNNIEAEIPVFIKPVVKLPTNLNTVENEKLKIHCIVFGKPAPEIYWSFSNDSLELENIELLNDTGTITLERDTEKDVENAILVIHDVQMWHRGKYTCFGNPPFNHKRINDTTMVRVKDKYAAVWPFLGICAEVFVLCAIILVYEKKRNKTELEESDTDQSPDQKNTPDHNKDSNLRHRQ